ncbi:MAG: helix-turn-helix transcriptional regulator [Gemmatimonadota bacterium]
MGNLGELETLVLLAILRLGDGAYGVSIGDEIQRRTGRTLSRGAIYSVLRRMQRKEQISSTLGEATPSRGGRAKRFWTLTDTGMDALRAAIANSDRMRQGLDELLA